MEAGQTSADRFIAREGWYFLGWTIDRQTVKSHDRFGAALIALSVVGAPIVAALVEPIAAVGMFGIATCGAVHFGVSRWAKSHPEVRDIRAPHLTRRAKKLLDRLVRHSIGTDPLGQKYYLRFMRQSAARAGKPIAPIMNAEAFAAFDRLATSYNRAYAAASESPEVGEIETRTMQEIMATGLDAVAALQEFPERKEAPSALIDELVAHLDRLTQVLEDQLASMPSDIRARLGEWNASLHVEESARSEQRS